MSSGPVQPDRVGAHFDALHVQDDPWSVHSSWYERRKAAVLLASLPASRYRLAWEPGCSIGGMTAQLAQRCDRVLASDVSSRALAAARRNLSALDTVDLREQQLPDDQPTIDSGAADLVVLGEFLYYLPVADVPRVLDIAARIQPPGGTLVVVHWRPQPDDAWQSGEQANQQVMDDERWRQIVHHQDEDFVLDLALRR